MLKKTDESVRGLQAAAADSAAAASKAARATEPASPEAVVAASQLELAAYASGVLTYLAEGRDFEALDLSQHVRLTIFKPILKMGMESQHSAQCKTAAQHIGGCEFRQICKQVQWLSFGDRGQSMDVLYSSSTAPWPMGPDDCMQVLRSAVPACRRWTLPMTPSTSMAQSSSAGRRWWAATACSAWCSTPWGTSTAPAHLQTWPRPWRTTQTRGGPGRGSRGTRRYPRRCSASGRCAWPW